MSEPETSVDRKGATEGAPAPESFSMRDLIRVKRDGGGLDAESIRRWIRGVVSGDVPDYQSAALLMAVVLRGMTREEAVALTVAMLRSGRVLDWSRLGRPTVDKHSTGGVGDKISIALAPWVAACGAAVPMIVGRGLGHTGGTLDKLEAIPGFRGRLSSEEFATQVSKIGLAIAGQGPDLAPADRELYALRDVTATVESIPLIAASILSKKLAAGASAIVFDVKAGRGAFFASRSEAKKLARELLEIAQALGQKARAIVTAMDNPLGRTVGNASETAEAFEVLHGTAPEDVVRLTRTLGAAMLVACGVARERFEAEARLDRALESGEALRRAESFVQAQGGDPRAVADVSRLPRAPIEGKVLATRSGYVAGIDSRVLGETLVALGGGRARKDEPVDPGVGIRLVRVAREQVRSGDVLAVVESRRDAPAAVAAVGSAYRIEDAPPAEEPIVLEQIEP
jgi:pyrimidine-nucleoside phosphorylase